MAHHYLYSVFSLFTLIVFLFFSCHFYVLINKSLYIHILSYTAIYI